jgi:hypothetical protein
MWRSCSLSRSSGRSERCGPSLSKARVDASTSSARIVRKPPLHLRSIDVLLTCFDVIMTS